MKNRRWLNIVPAGILLPVGMVVAGCGTLARNPPSVPGQSVPVPARWRMGFGSAITGDDRGHIWILSRPDGLRHPRRTAPDLTSTAAPPVMEFDQEGNFNQGWGGESGPGYQWPSNEHGLTVDSRGHV